MSTEYYLYDAKNNDVICLRDIIKPELYDDFITNYAYTNYVLREGLKIIIDDAVDTYSPLPNRIKIKKGPGD